MEILEMTFEKVKGFRLGRSGINPTITIGCAGKILFNNITMHLYLDSITHVRFYYNARTKQLAIRPLIRDGIPYKTLHSSQITKSHYVSASHIFNEIGFYDWKDGALVYDVVWNDERKEMVINLKEGKRR